MPKRSYKTSVAVRRRRHRPRKSRPHRFRRGKSSRVKGSTLIYKSPHQNPMPQVWYGKFHSKVMGVFTTNGVNPLGFNVGSTNRVYVNLNTLTTSPWSNFGATQGLAGAPAFNTLLPVGITNLLNQHIYNTYQVLGAKLLFRLIPSPVSANDATVAAITFTRDSTTNPVAFNNAIDQPWTKYRIFKGGAEDKPIVHYCPFAKFLGVKKSVFNNDDTNVWAAAYNQDPSDRFYAVINMNTCDATNLSNSMPFEIELTSYVKLFMNNNASLQ